MYTENVPGLWLDKHGRVYFGNDKYSSGQSDRDIVRRDVSKNDRDNP